MLQHKLLQTDASLASGLMRYSKGPLRSVGSAMKDHEAMGTSLLGFFCSTRKIGPSIKYRDHVGVGTRMSVRAGDLGTEHCTCWST